jgi:hypothetical protein
MYWSEIMDQVRGEYTHCGHLWKRIIYAGNRWSRQSKSITVPLTEAHEESRDRIKLQGKAVTFKDGVPGANDRVCKFSAMRRRR